MEEAHCLKTRGLLQQKYMNVLIENQCLDKYCQCLEILSISKFQSTKGDVGLHQGFAHKIEYKQSSLDNAEN